MTTESKKPGIIYCVSNPLFPHLVKIGKTTKSSFKERILDTAFLPENFNRVWEYEVDDIDATEKSVHRVCKEFSYKPESKEKGEFFYKCAIEKARECVEPYSNKKADARTKDDAKSQQKAKNKTFLEAKVPIKAKIYFQANKSGRNQNEEAVVVDDINQVELYGKEMSISAAAAKLLGVKAAAGFDHFKYEGELISDRYFRMIAK